MPRPDSRRPALFRGYELTRIIAAALLLGIIGLYYFQAVNPKTWVGLARDDTAESEDDDPQPASTPIVEWKETVTPIPDSDGASDPLEQDAYKEETLAVEDKTVVQPEEMASYWRLRDPEVAEVAFAVADALQARGVGTRLLEQLAARASAVGISTFLAEVLS